MKTTWYRSVAVQSYRVRHQSKRRRQWADVIEKHLVGTKIPNPFQKENLQWYEETQVPEVKVLPIFK